MTLRKAEMEAEINAEISKRRTELNSLKETLAAGGDRVTRTELKSPVRGTVKQIYINTVGGVVKPGEAIMEIVPLDDTLLVEAWSVLADVAFLHPGQKAMVKISAYDFSIYGGLEADLEQISADTIEDKRGEFFYLVKVRTHKNAISYRKEQLPIIPGMVTTVDILTGKTVLDYILKPVPRGPAERPREGDPMLRWLRVLAGLLAVSVFVGLPYPGAFASDDDDEILLKRSSNQFASAEPEQGGGCPGCGAVRPASSRNPGRARAGTGGAGGPGW